MTTINSKSYPNVFSSNFNNSSILNVSGVTLGFSYNILLPTGCYNILL